MEYWNLMQLESKPVTIKQKGMRGCVMNTFTPKGYKSQEVRGCTILEKNGHMIAIFLFF